MTGWTCPKCGNTTYEADGFQATGGGFAKIFDVQNKRFTTVSCTRCHFTELYRAAPDELMDIFDFFIGG